MRRSRSTGGLVALSPKGMRDRAIRAVGEHILNADHHEESAEAVVTGEEVVPDEVIGSEALMRSFRDSGQAVAAADSSPIRVADPVSLGRTAAALWRHKHQIPSFDLHVVVAGSGICLAILALGKRARTERGRISVSAGWVVATWMAVCSLPTLSPFRRRLRWSERGIGHCNGEAERCSWATCSGRVAF